MDNRQNLRYLPMVLRDVEHLEQYRFFILVPQCPSTEIVWTSNLETVEEQVGQVVAGTRRVPSAISGTRRVPTTGSTGPDDMLTVAEQLLQKTMREQPVDPDRVYLLGISSGGTGAWEMALRHPDWFAAVVPISPDHGDPSQAAKLAAIPIWVFHDNGDRPEATQRMVEAVEAAGGNIHLSLSRTGQHDAWTVALRGFDVVDWMLEQRRGAWICWRPPGCKPWRWWHILGVPLAFAGIVCVGWYSERRRRRSEAESREARGEAPTDEADRTRMKPKAERREPKWQNEN